MVWNKHILSRAASFAAFAVPFGIYVASLTPGVGFWDTAEMQTVPYIFGIAHPTGFPSFVMLGYLFSHVFACGNVAWRLTVMSAIAMSAAAWFVFRTLVDEGVDPLFGCIAAWTFSFGYVAWTRGTRAEVHALAICFIAAAIWSALRARSSGATAPLYVCALSVGLAAATHPVVIWILPGLMVLLAEPWLWRDHPWRKGVFAFCFLFVPLLAYLYMPLRSAFVTTHHLDPTLGLGLPPGQAFWDWGHPATLHNFIRTLTGARFPKSDALGATLKLLLYPSFAKDFAIKTLGEYGIIVSLLAVAGAIELFFRDPAKAVGLLLAALLGIPFALSYTIESDYDRYFLTAYWVMALLAGLGALAVVRRAPRGGSVIAFAIATGLLLTGVAQSINKNRDVFRQRTDISGSAFIDRARRETPANGVIVASWVYAAPLAYAAYVEQSMGQRIIASAEPNEITQRLLSWTSKRPVFVIYFEPFKESPTPIRGAQLVRVGSEEPAIYRVHPMR